MKTETEQKKLIDRRKILQMKSDGKSVREIAKVVGCSTGYAFNVIKSGRAEHQIGAFSGRPSTLTPQQQQAIRELAAQGVPMKQIAGRLDICFNNVYYFITSNKIKTVSGKRQGRVDHRQVFRLHDEGLSPQRIADLLECSRQMVNHIIRKGRPAAEGKISPTLVREWAELVQQGRTINSIAEEYKVGHHTISRHLEWHKEKDQPDGLSEFADSRGMFDPDKYRKACYGGEWHMSGMAPVKSYSVPAGKGRASY